MVGRRSLNAAYKLILVSALFWGHESLLGADGNPPLRDRVGGELLGWVPYIQAPVVSFPSFLLPDGTLTLPYGATLVNYNEQGKKQFILSLATELDLDHQRLRLIPVDEAENTVLGVTYSVFEAQGVKQQTISFVGTISENPNKLHKFLVVLFPRRNPQPQLEGSRKPGYSKPAPPAAAGN